MLLTGNTSAFITSTATAACKLCDKPGTLLYSKLKDILFSVPGNWSLMTCETCELAWLYEQPKTSEIYKLYETYHTHDEPNLTFDYGFHRFKWIIRKCVLSYANHYRGNRLEKIIGFLFSLIPGMRENTLSATLWVSGPQGDLLDVGCGNGVFLKKMANLDWKGFGVEFDPNSVKQANKIGLDVNVGSLEDDHSLADVTIVESG